MKNAILTALISVASAYLFIAFAPLSWFPNNTPRTFGASITTILGTDTLSASRTTINNNFSSLNTSKFELSDWYSTTSAKQLTTLANLATVGTIISGIWNGTAVTVPYGGTSSTTLSANQVLLGNGTSGIKTPIGWGSSGQVLTSAGAGAAPTWSSGAIDTTINYSWTGTNLFKNFNASGTVANPLAINGVSYAFTSSQGAASSTLTNDGSGNLTWALPKSTTLAAQALELSTNSSATTTLYTVVLPANTLTNATALRVNASYWLTQVVSSGCTYQIDLGTGNATSALAFGVGNNSFLSGMVFSTTTSRQQSTFTTTNNVTFGDVLTINGFQQYSSHNTAAPLYLAFRARAQVSSFCALIGASVEKLTN